MESYYKVTQSVIVRAQNSRHAAHIVKGMQKRKFISLDPYQVERLDVASDGVKVDLSKEMGEKGYSEKL